jgi:hypothetical protein
VKNLLLPPSSVVGCVGKKVSGLSPEAKVGRLY